MYLFVSLKIMRYESLLRHLDSKTAILQIPPKKLFSLKKPYLTFLVHLTVKSIANNFLATEFY